MNTIRQAFKEAPRTMTIAAVWLLWIVGMLVWVTVKDGILWAVGALVAAIVIGIGLHLLNRWAAKGDGLEDQPEPPPARVEEMPINASRSGLITTSKWKFTIPAGDIKSDRGYFPQSINAGAHNGEHVIFLGYTDAGAEFFRPDVKGETTVRWYAIYGNDR